MLGTGSSITGTTSAIYIGKDWTASGYQDVFDYGLYMASGTCARALYVTAAISGSTAWNAIEVVTTDTQTNATNYSRSLYLNHTSSGAKTGSGEVNVLGIDLSITESIAGYAYGASFYIAPTSGKNINHMAGISMYLENCGTGTVSRYYGIDIGKVSTNTASASDAFMRMYSTGTTTTGAFFRIEGKSTYAFDFQGNVAPIADDSVTGHGGTVYKIKCRVGATDIYLLASSAPS